MKTQIKKAAQQRTERHKETFYNFYLTAYKAQRQIEKLIEACEPAEQRQLRKDLKPITRASIERAIALDKKIRGLL